MIIFLGGLTVGGLGLLSLILSDQFGHSEITQEGTIMFPPVMSVGYDVINATLEGEVVISLLLLLGILKVFATAITIGSGGSGGVFAPTLYIGTVLGGAFGIAFSVLFPTIIVEPMAFALVGMAALFAGTGRAPITCIVMVMEMTGDYNMILPLMIAVSISYLIASSLDEECIYTLKLSRKGININRDRYVSALREVTVDQIMTVKPTVLRPDMTIQEVFPIVAATQHTKFPVVDSDNKVIGILLTEDLFQDGSDTTEVLVRDVMSQDFIHITPTCTMDSVVHFMLERLEGHAVIVNPERPMVMIGFITKADVLKAYELAIIKLQEEGEITEAFIHAKLVDVK